ncbi:MAG: DUF4160 domain-containing protein, partial [Planctomycetia bacterium]
DNHAPAHVHVEYQARKAKIDLEGTILKGSLGSKTAEKLVREWLVLRSDQLERDWELAMKGEPLEKIAPLDQGGTSHERQQ